MVDVIWEILSIVIGIGGVLSTMSALNSNLDTLALIYFIGTIVACLFAYTMGYICRKLDAIRNVLLFLEEPQDSPAQANDKDAAERSASAQHQESEPTVYIEKKWDNI